MIITLKIIYFFKLKYYIFKYTLKSYKVLSFTYKIALHNVLQKKKKNIERMLEEWKKKKKNILGDIFMRYVSHRL
jgi:hypothetical protein